MARTLTKTSPIDADPFPSERCASPPRYWWLKRIVAAYIIWAIAIVAIWFWWDHTARTRLDATLAKYKADGQPVYIEDFQPRVVPDEENAAVGIAAAATARVLPPNPYAANNGGQQTLDETLFLEKPDRMLACADDGETWLEKNRAALEGYRSATALNQYEEGPKFKSPTITAALGPFVDQRAIAKLATAAASMHAANRESPEAHKLVVATLRHRNLLLGGGRTLIQALVATAIGHIAANVVEEQPLIGRNEFLSDDYNDELIAVLLDEDAWTRGWLHAFDAERMSIVDTFTVVLPNIKPAVATMLGTPRFYSSVLARLGRPVLFLDTQYAARTLTAFRNPFLHHVFDPAAVQNPRFIRGIDDITHSGSHLLLPSLSRAVYLGFRELAHTRMAAITIALRMYERDFGVLPQRLSDLVPHYLPDIPADPFDPFGQTFRYVWDRESPYLYSLGENCNDDGGRTLSEDEKRKGIRDEPDFRFYINGIPLDEAESPG